MRRHNSQISPDVEDFHLFHTHTKEKSVILKEKGEEEWVQKKQQVFTPNDSQLFLEY